MKFVGISFLLAYFPFATFLALVGARENTSCYTRLRRSVVRIMQELAMVAFILFIGIAIVLSPYVAALADMQAKELDKYSNTAREASQGEDAEDVSAEEKAAQDVETDTPPQQQNDESTAPDSETSSFMSENDRGMSEEQEATNDQYSQGVGLRQRRVIRTLQLYCSLVLQRYEMIQRNCYIQYMYHHE